MALNRYYAARILAEAHIRGDKPAARRNSVAVRTIKGYRRRLSHDPELDRLFREHVQLLGKDWAEDTINALREGFGAMEAWFRVAREEAQAGKKWQAGVLREVAGGVKIIGELQVVREALGVPDGPENDRPGPALPTAEGGTASSEPATPLH